jgi:hypothetical protein
LRALPFLVFMLPLQRQWGGGVGVVML